MRCFTITSVKYLLRTVYPRMMCKTILGILSSRLGLVVKSVSFLRLILHLIKLQILIFDFEFEDFII